MYILKTCDYNQSLHAYIVVVWTGYFCSRLGPSFVIARRGGLFSRFLKRPSPLHSRIVSISLFNLFLGRQLAGFFFFSYRM